MTRAETHGTPVQSRWANCTKGAARRAAPHCACATPTRRSTKPGPPRGPGSVGLRTSRPRRPRLQSADERLALPGLGVEELPRRLGPADAEDVAVRPVRRRRVHLVALPAARQVPL